MSKHTDEEYVALEAQVKVLSAPVTYEECCRHGLGSGLLSVLEINRLISTRAALAATEPKPVREVSKPQSWGFSGYLEVLPDTATEPPAQTSSIESTYRERE